MKSPSPTHQQHQHATAARPTHQHRLCHTKFLFLLLVVVAISGCSLDHPFNGNELIWDYRNENLEITLLDDEGQSLIDPTTDEGLALLSQISIDYDGKHFPLNDRAAREMRDMVEGYRDFFLRYRDGRYVLSFGEFQPNYKDLQILYLNLPGDEQHRISFTHTVRKNTFDSSVWLDDQLEPHSNSLRNVVIYPKNNGEAFRVSPQARPAPVTLYIYPLLPTTSFAVDELTRDRSIPQEEFANYQITLDGKTYPLVSSNDANGLSLTTGNSRFIRQGGFYNKEPFLAFGPIPLENNYHNKEITVSYKGIEKQILFNCYLDTNKKAVYEAWSGDDNTKNILYFRNGPLVIVDWNR
ncbi:MAG: hypothetical protein PUI84_06375 [Bacteroidales bacterium]|nr:hypothetical protein [Porphyromonas sp.]MDD6934927.1 hypothetical protein [Bacteroidales bacterium]MDY3102119.1 hypothetical protein [Porphyromonas sp.]